MFESTAEKTEKKVNVKDMTVIALVTAVICIIAPFSIPIAISPIPITLALFALFLAGIILGKWKGVVCTVIYLLLGMVGLPVFNGFSGRSTETGGTNRWLSDRLPVFGIFHRIIC